MKTLLRRIAAVILLVLAPIGTLVVYLATRTHLPDPLPVHWDLRGTVNNTAGVAPFFTTVIVISAALALGAIAAAFGSHVPAAGRMLAALLAFGTWIAAGTGISTAGVSAGHVVALGVRLPWYFVIPVVLVPTLVAIAVWALLPGRWPQPDVGAPREAALAFAPGESVVWIDHVQMPWLRWGAALAAIVAAVMVWVASTAVIPFAILAVVGVMTSELAVRIDSRGLHTLWGPFGWPRPRIPLERIVSVHAEDIDPMQWGGWGYRVSRRGVAAVIRRGPGLVVSRRGGPDYAVTVPHAAAGARVLDGLMARLHQS